MREIRKIQQRRTSVFLLPGQKQSRQQLPLADQIHGPPHPTSGRLLSPTTPRPSYLHPRPSPRHNRAQPRQESQISRPLLLLVIRAPPALNSYLQPIPRVLGFLWNSFHLLPGLSRPPSGGAGAVGRGDLARPRSSTSWHRAGGGPVAPAGHEGRC